LEARSATAQARLTRGMVVAMPVAVGLPIELVAPGFLGSLIATRWRRCSSPWRSGCSSAPGS